ncbi:MAG: sugar phosphate nucleotidyltransferase [Thermaerobacter sp.]|nr:sugar phosphate nucleotidyltransferase [Thermaerobacter sp.]
METTRPTITVIMAGGPGERLWPLSRPGRPKPLVEVQGETLVSRAYRRAMRLSGQAARIYVIGLEADRARMLEALPELPKEHFLGEPLRRDTAMAVLSAAQVVASAAPDAVIAVLPADHVMRDEDAFARAAGEAVRLAKERDGICLMGALPTGPRPEFGYIVSEDGPGDRIVDRFVEKPDPAHATRLISEGALWNMGVFIGDVRSLLGTAEIVAPELSKSSRAAAQALLLGNRTALSQAYETSPKQPFDRAVLERSTDLRVVPCDAGWSDLGNWPEFVRFHREGPDGDKTPLEWREPGSPPVQVLGADDLIVCSTPAGTLVASLEASAKVRPPQPEGPSFVPEGARVVEKPWGAEYIWAETERYAGKLLFVKAGHSLSLQYHEKKMESMWVLQGTGILEIDGAPRAISPGSTITILPGTMHRLEAHIDLSVLEVSTPELDDVVRVKDLYGRS